MKNILVPTDFSECASNATEYAIALSKILDAQIFLFTTLDIPKSWKDGELSPEQIQNIKNEKVLLQQWQKQAKEENVEIKTFITGGNFLENLEQQVNEVNADFVIMGSHGVSGKQEYFIGSNTQKAVRKLHLPIIVIKNPVTDFGLKNVVFASSFNENEKVAFQYLLDFLKPFSPETIHLLSIKTSGWFSQSRLLMEEAMKDFQEMSLMYKSNTHLLQSFSIDAGVRKFSEEINADMIAVSHLERNTLSRIFTGSNVEALVNHAERPVLCIDIKE